MEWGDLFAFAPGEHRAELWAGLLFTLAMVIALAVHLAYELGVIG